MVGQANVINARLRVIDGESDTNLTGEGTDLFLPVDFGNGSFESMAVNSANHKVYIVKSNGDVVVVDGPNRQVLTTLHPDAGNLIIANPAANKVFVVNHNGGAVIDSSNDTFTHSHCRFMRSTQFSIPPLAGSTLPGRRNPRVMECLRSMGIPDN